MRQHISVFGIYIRSSLYKVLGLLAAMAAVEGVLFAWTLDSTLKEAKALAESGIQDFAGMGVNLSLEYVLESSYIKYVFIVFSLLITVVLCMIGCERGSKQGYTLRRLSISESAVVLWQSLCNTCCYFLLWVVQTGIALGGMQPVCFKVGDGERSDYFSGMLPQ